MLLFRRSINSHLAASLARGLYHLSWSLLSSPEGSITSPNQGLLPSPEEVQASYKLGTKKNHMVAPVPIAVKFEEIQ